jgi:5-formaminoimidazole-4-carboxamide-1-(beta)-D-ribofuranosyl 5'-monophosphate synthetase
MITRDEMQQIVGSYNKDNIHIVILGSHSAKEMGVAAKRAGFKTILFCQEDRDELYTQHNKHLFDHILIRPKFSQMADLDVQGFLREHNGIVMPHRSFAVYLTYDVIENDFRVPIYGSRYMLRAEERTTEKSQYYLMAQAGMRLPKQVKRPEDISFPVIVKIQQKDNKLERAFFYATTMNNFWETANKMIEAGEISREDLDNAVIEEFVIGPRFNANFQIYALRDIFGELDLLGFGDRRQVNIGGILNLTAEDQLKLPEMSIRNEEIGHMGVTMRESKQMLTYDQARLFVKEAAKTFAPGIIGPLGLQGAVQYKSGTKKLEFVIFDLSLRNSGDPHIASTSPDMENLNLKYQPILKTLRTVECNNPRTIGGPLDLAMMEIEVAIRDDRLKEIIT